MRQRLMWFLGAVIVGAGTYASTLLATPSSGFMGTTLAVARFDEIDVNLHTLPANFWQSRQKTQGLSDVYVQSNVWQPGGSTGWHTHPGHSLIIVTSGTITEYEADCTPHVYTFVPGQPAPTLVDPGRDHEHIIRNEGSVAASTIAVQLVPYDPNKANRRIDAPAPANCSNIL